MHFLRDWSLWKVLLVCGGWVVLAILAPVAWALLPLFRQMQSQGSGGIASVSAGLTEPYFWIVILPPVVLFVAWASARWIGRAPAL